MANSHSLLLVQDSSQFAYHADAAAFDITGDISMEAWIRLPTTGLYGEIMAKYRGIGTSRSYLFHLKSTGVLSCTISSDGTTTNMSTSETDDAQITSADTWYHVAVTIDVSVPTFIFYINGVAVDTTANTTAATSIANSSVSFNVGCQGDAGVLTGSYFPGYIDEPRLWNDVRTPTEILNNYNKELVGNEDNLVFYSKFNNSADDETSNGNDLTLVNSPNYSTDVPFAGSTPTTVVQDILGGGIIPFAR